MNSLGGEIKKPWFIELNPNAKLPVLIDHDNKHFTIPESRGRLTHPMLCYPIQRKRLTQSAINGYLLQKFDPEFKFHFKDHKDQTPVFIWASWQNSEVASTTASGLRWFR
jgi:glutathione S-transferase